MNTPELEALRAFRQASVHAVWLPTRRPLRTPGCAPDRAQHRNAGPSEPGAELPARLGQPLRCAQRRHHGPGARSRRWSPPIRWRPRRPGMRSTPASGRAATRKRAPSAAITPIRIATPMASRSWPAGTTPGWSRCLAAAPVGRRRCGCAGCGRGRTPIWWPPSRSAPGCAKRPRAVPAATPLPIFSFDAGYDSVQLSLALADAPVCLLVRLRAGRCFYADPTSQPPTGRPRRHGAKFVCDDPTTWPEPTDQWSTDDPQYGHVQLQAWSGLHPIPQQHAQRGTRHPRAATTPARWCAGR